MTRKAVEGSIPPLGGISTASRVLRNKFELGLYRTNSKNTALVKLSLSHSYFCMSFRSSSVSDFLTGSSTSYPPPPYEVPANESIGTHPYPGLYDVQLRQSVRVGDILAHSPYSGHEVPGGFFLLSMVASEYSL